MNNLILYFETTDKESRLPLAHSVYVADKKDFSLSVRNNGNSEYCLTLTLSGREYIIEESSDWLDSSRSSFYWQEKVILSFNRIIKRFTYLAENAENHIVTNLAAIAEDEYDRFIS